MKTRSIPHFAVFILVSGLLFFCAASPAFAQIDIASGFGGYPPGVYTYTGSGTTLSDNIFSYCQGGNGGGNVIQNIGTGALTLDGSFIALNGEGGLNFDDNGSGIIVNGAIETPFGAPNVIKITEGNVTFDGANIFSSGLFIAGTLNINAVSADNSAQSLGGDTGIVLGGGTNNIAGVLNYTGAGGTWDGSITVNGNGNGYDTIQNSGSGTLNLTGFVTIYSTVLNLNDNGSGINVAGAIGEGSPGGSVVVTGGNVSLTGLNTYTGDTSVNAGELNINTVDVSTNPQSLGEGGNVNLGVAGVSSGILNYTGSGGTLDKNINSLGNGGDTIQSIGSGLLTLVGTLTNGGAGLNFNDSGSGITVSGVIQDGVVTGSPITITGGNVTFAGANTYTGITNINAGELNINTVDVSANPQSLGQGSTVNLGVAGTSSGVLNYTGSGGTLDKNINSLGNGGDTIQNSGSGLLTLVGTLTNSGEGLNFNDNGSGITVSGNIVEGGVGWPVGVTGGNVTFAGANTYTGITNINAGTLNINTVDVSTNPQPLGEGSAVFLGVAATSSGVLNYTGSGGTLDKNIRSLGNGSDTIQNSGSGLLILDSGMDNYGGGLNFNDNGSGIKVIGVIDGSGGPVTITGGNVTFNNLNTYTGDTNINAGTLNINLIDVSTNAQSLGEGDTVNLGVAGVSSGVLDYTYIGGYFTMDKNINSLGNGGDTIQNTGNGFYLSGAVTNGGGGLNFDGGGSGIGINVNGVIQDGVVTGAPITITGGNVIFNGANTYTGNTNISAGTLFINTVDVSTNAQSLGQGSTVNLGVAGTSSGVLNYTGSGGTLDKNINALGNGLDTIQNDGTGLLTLSGTLTKNGTVLTLNSGGSGITVTGVIAGPSSGSDLRVTGAATTTLGSANTYNGPTIVYGGGILSISTLANGGSSSSIGASSNEAANLVLDGGTLVYTGGQTSTDRLFSVGTGGGTIDSIGSGPVSFTNTGAMGFNGETGARTLTLEGSTAGNVLDAAIGDDGGATSVVVLTGAWTLNGNNTYTGSTTIEHGVEFILRDNPGNTPFINNGDLQVDYVGNIANLLSGSGNYIFSGTSNPTTITGSNPYTGSTIVNSGAVLRVDGAIEDTSGIMVNPGASVEFTLRGNPGNAPFVNNGILQVDYVGNIVNLLSGSGNYIFSGTSNPTTLTGSNPYTGLTIVNSGAVLRVDGAIADTSGVTVNPGASVEFTLRGNPGNAPFVNNGILQVDYVGNIVNLLSGSGNYIFSGTSNPTTITGSNPYTGLTIVNSGAVLRVDGAITNTSGVTVNPGASLEFTLRGNPGNAPFVNNGILQVDYTGNIINLLSGSGNYIFSGTSNPTTITGSNPYTGLTIVNSGAVLRVDGAITNTSGVTVNPGASLEFTLRGNPGNAPFVNNGILQVDYTGNIINLLSGSGNYIFSGTSNPTTITGSNPYTGLTIVNSGAVLRVDGAIANTSGVTVNPGASLEFTLRGNPGNAPFVNNGILQVDYTGNIINLLSGSGNYIFSGTSNPTTITGSNPYTGSTIVNSGAILTVNGSIASSSSVTVSAGATLAGSGFVGLVKGGGLVAPGDPTILNGTQVDPSGGLSFNFQFSQLGQPTYSNSGTSGNSVYHLTGATPFVSPMTSANTITVDFSPITLSLANGQIYYGGFFLDNAATLGDPTFDYTGTGDFSVEYKGLVLVSNADFATGTVSGYEMEFEVVPEPSTWTMLALGGAGLFTVLRRRNRW